MVGKFGNTKLQESTDKTFGQGKCFVTVCLKVCSVGYTFVTTTAAQRAQQPEPDLQAASLVAKLIHAYGSNYFASFHPSTIFITVIFPRGKHIVAFNIVMFMYTSSDQRAQVETYTSVAKVKRQRGLNAPYNCTFHRTFHVRNWSFLILQRLIPLTFVKFCPFVLRSPIGLLNHLVSYKRKTRFQQIC